MKTTDLLDIMGEIHENYIEDAANPACENTPRIKRLSRYGAIAAAIGILCISVYTIYGVVRDGIMQPPQTGYTSAADSAESAAVTSDTHADTETAEQTLPTDLFVIETPEFTTATAETDDSLPFPADAEMPDASLEQEIGNRFLVNDTQIVQSGVLAMSVLKAECFDTLAEAGLTEDDLLRSFREGYAIGGGSVGYIDDNGEKQNFITAELCEPFPYNRNLAYINEHAADWRFVLLTVKVDNLNAVSSLPPHWNSCIMPADPFRYLNTETQFNPREDDSVSDSGFARDYDFSLLPMQFRIHKADEHSAYGLFTMSMAYCSRSGLEYDDVFRSEWLYLEPGMAITLKIGAFLPKTLTPDLMSNLFQDESEWDEQYPRYGEDLKNYYYFGSAGIAKPHVNLHFDDPEDE